MIDTAHLKVALGIHSDLEAIDPAGCGCTECIVGEYLPMEQMEPKHVLGMALGILRNNTDYPDPVMVRSIEFAFRTYDLSEVLPL